MLINSNMAGEQYLYICIQIWPELYRCTKRQVASNVYLYIPMRRFNLIFWIDTGLFVKSEVVCRGEKMNTS